MASPDQSEVYRAEERISPRITESLESEYRDSYQAIFELFDNPYDERDEGRALIISVELDRNHLRIKDVGGKGMGREELDKFLYWGESDKAAQREAIGRYGWGGKAAMKALARERKLVSALHGGTEVLSLNLQETIIKGDRKYYDVHVTKTRPGLGFVEIELEGMNFDVNEQKLRQRIARTYRLALREQKLSIKLNANWVQPEEIPVAAKYEDFRFTLWEDAEISGWVGELPEDLKVDITPGLRGNVNGRLIEEGICFDLPSLNTRPGLRRLIGEFDVNPPKMELTIGKSAFIRDNTWVLLNRKMMEILSPYADKLIEAHEGGAHVPKLERAAINASFEIVRRTLTELGEVTYGIRRRSEERTGVRPTGAETGRQNAPRTPAPDEAVGKRVRLGNIAFMEFQRKNLGKNTRSSVVVTETGKALAICPEYIGYIQARENGHLTEYNLETAALELAKMAAQEETSSRNYQEKFSREFDRYYRVFLQAYRRNKSGRAS